MRLGQWTLCAGALCWISLPHGTLDAQTVVFSEDFESGLNGWSITNGVWEFGANPAGPPGNVALKGVNCAATVLASGYPPNADSSLVSPEIILPPAPGADEIHLRFWQWFSYGGADSASVEISVFDSGTSTWSPFTSVMQVLSTPVGIGYASTVWAPASIDLTAYASETVRVQFTHQASSASGAGAGWLIDDLEIRVSIPEFTTDFENGWGDWWTSRGVFELGSNPAGPPGDVAFQGQNCIGTVMAPGYPSDTDSELNSPTTTLEAVVGDEELHLRFWQWFSYGGAESASVEISVFDPGSSTWSPFTSVMQVLSTPVGIGYASTVWAPASIDLTAYAGETVRFRFVHQASSASGTGSGWFIDALELRRSIPEFTTDFEGGWGDWWTSRGVFEIGSNPVGPPGDVAFQGQNCIGTVMAAGYPSDTDSELYSPTTTLDAVTGDEELHLLFWQWFSYGGADSASVEISVFDSASATWAPFTSVMQVLSTPVAVGYASAVWAPASIDLTAYAGETVRFRFVHQASSASGTGSGWFIDALELRRSIPEFTTDFEGGWGDWWTSRGVFEIGSNPVGPPGDVAFQGQNCIGTVMAAGYPSDTDSELYSPTIPLPTVMAPEPLVLTAHHWFSFGGGDSGQVELSSLDPQTDVWSTFTAVSPIFTGSSGNWTPLSIDLTAHAGEKVRLRFRHVADCCGAGSGWFIDAFQLDGPEFRRADVNEDDAVDIADAISILAALFQGEPNSCWDAMDTNDSGQVTIADPIYLVSHLFSSGPPPLAPYLLCGTDPTPDSLGCLQYSCP